MMLNILIAAIAIFHIGFFYMETVAWTSVGRRAFKGYPKEFFEQTKVMAQNQGVYNLFLAAGLIWSLLIEDIQWSQNVATFFLGCVVVAGIAGAITADKKIFWIQSLPALIAILILIVSS